MRKLMRGKMRGKGNEGNLILLIKKIKVTDVKGKKVEEERRGKRKRK